MIVETIIILVNTILTIIFLKFAYKALHIRSRCSKCCDVEIETEAKE